MVAAPAHPPKIPLDAPVFHQQICFPPLHPIFFHLEYAGAKVLVERLRCVEGTTPLEFSISDGNNGLPWGIQEPSLSPLTESPHSSRCESIQNQLI
jgi:hypothetical protein